MFIRFLLGIWGLLDYFKAEEGKNKTAGYNGALRKGFYNEYDFYETLHFFRDQARSDGRHSESKKQHVSGNQQASIL